jgi:phosphate starvation-inducible protein PhoH
MGKSDYFNDFQAYNDNRIIDERKIIDKIIPNNITIKSKNDSQKELINSIKNNEITICSGQAGSGKTYISVGYALNLIRKTSSKYRKIYLIKSVIPLKGEEIGFLKGDYMEKIEPYMQSYYLNLEKFISKASLNNLLNEEIIKPFPVAFLRGTSIDDAIIIVDECVGGDSKVIIKFNKNLNKRYISMKMLYKHFLKNESIYVLSYNENTKIKEYKKINSIRITNNKETFKLLFSSSKPIIATNNHPFAIYNNGKIEYKKLKDLNIGDRLIKRKNAMGNHSILNENNYDILLGFVLGDAGFTKNKQNDKNIYRLNKNHSLKQSEYCKFCADLYNTKTNNNYRSGFTGEIQSSFRTKSFYLDKKFVNSFYNGKKKITSDIEKYITERSLALWYMDDGSIYKYNNDESNISFHSEGFTKEENQILVNILQNKFNIESKVFNYKKEKTNENGEKYKTNYYCIRIGKNGSNILQNLIKEYVHPSMYYKLQNKYQNHFNLKHYYTYENDYENTTLEIKDIIYNGVERVYNMEVEDNNNYYVNNILTHNCQNLSMSNMETIMSRLSNSSKMIILGDTNQIDLKNKNESSLSKLIKLFKNKINGINVVEMNDADDNVRNPLIKHIDKVFREYFKTNKL